MKQPLQNREELEKEATELGVPLEGRNSRTFNFSQYNSHSFEDLLKLLEDIQKITTNSKTISFEYQHECYNDSCCYDCNNIDVNFSFDEIKDNYTLGWEIKRKKQALKEEAKYKKQQKKLKEQENLKKEQRERKTYEKLKKKYEPV